MQECITIEMLEELTEEQKTKLREKWEPKKGDLVLYEEGEGYWVDGFDKENILPLLSIGQMIGILRYYEPKIEYCEWLDRKTDKYYMGWEISYYNENISINNRSEYFRDEDLVTALWQAVKSIL